MLNFEDSYYNKKTVHICGVDEVGRGPLCGPVVASCVILDKNYRNKDIDDSKKLTAKKREELFAEINNNAIAIGIGIVSPKEIDKLNIYEASKKAMLIALNEVKKKNIKIDLIFTDYMPLEFNNIRVISLEKGDSKVRCVAAASIIAKVTRDKIMDEYDKLYHEYNFKNHKGYPTKEHIKIINKLGIIKGFYRESYKPVQEALNKKIFLFDINKFDK